MKKFHLTFFLLFMSMSFIKAQIDVTGIYIFKHKTLFRKTGLSLISLSNDNKAVVLDIGLGSIDVIVKSKFERYSDTIKIINDSYYKYFDNQLTMYGNRKLLEHERLKKANIRQIKRIKRKYSYLFKNNNLYFCEDILKY